MSMMFLPKENYQIHSCKLKLTSVKVAKWKKSYSIILNLKQNLNFPAQNWESGFVLVFGRKMSSLLQNTGSADSQWLKNWGQLLKRWQEKKILTLLYVENYTRAFQSEPPLQETCISWCLGGKFWNMYLSVISVYINLT